MYLTVTLNLKSLLGVNIKSLFVQYVKLTKSMYRAFCRCEKALIDKILSLIIEQLPHNL